MDSRLGLACAPLSKEDDPVHLRVEIDSIARRDSSARSAMPLSLERRAGLAVYLVRTGTYKKSTEWLACGLEDAWGGDVHGLPSGLPHCM